MNLDRMTAPARDDPSPTPLKLLLLALALGLGLFLLEGNIGINLNDEGYLWYGTIRTALGDFPVRDFQSYDPGRYYWGAFWFKLLGRQGILTLRLSLSLFQSLGLAFGLLALRRVLHSWWTLVPAALVLQLWMVPLYKVFEATICLGAVLFAVRLVERPTLRRHFVGGVFVGLAACFGRNHALYCSVSFLLVIAFVQLRVDRGNLARRLAAWSAGAMVGYSPVLLMFLTVPGLFDAFFDSTMTWVRIGATNRPRQVPWPWTPPHGSYFEILYLPAATYFIIGTLFVLQPLLLAVGALWLLWQRDLRRKALLVAAVAVGLPYMHYAFSRADFGHLASSLPPLLLAIMAIPASTERLQRRGVVASVLCLLLAASFLAAGSEHPYYSWAVQGPERFSLGEIGGDHVWVFKKRLAWIRVMRRLRAKMTGEEPFLIAPVLPGLYPVLGIKAPVWTLVFGLPHTRQEQEQMIATLARKRVDWAFLCDRPLDSNEALRLSKTDAYLWQHIADQWMPVSIRELRRSDPTCQLWRRRRHTQVP